MFLDIWWGLPWTRHQPIARLLPETWERNGRWIFLTKLLENYTVKLKKRAHLWLNYISVEERAYYSPARFPSMQVKFCNVHRAPGFWQRSLYINFRSTLWGICKLFGSDNIIEGVWVAFFFYCFLPCYSSLFWILIRLRLCFIISCFLSILYCPRQFPWRLYSKAVILNLLFTIWFVQ